MQPNGSMAWLHTNVWVNGRIIATYEQNSKTVSGVTTQDNLKDQSGLEAGTSEDDSVPTTADRANRARNKRPAVYHLRSVSYCNPQSPKARDRGHRRLGWER